MMPAKALIERRQFSVNSDMKTIVANAVANVSLIITGFIREKQEAIAIRHFYLLLARMPSLSASL